MIIPQFSSGPRVLGRPEEALISTPDGGALGLATYGYANAPGERRVLVVGGAFLTALIYRPFAVALSGALGQAWAVDVYDRRGRGASTAQPADYGMDTEISDVTLMLRHTGARNLFGHSLGGSVVLNAVQALQGHDAGDHRFADRSLVPAKIAVYDPAINIEREFASSWMQDFIDHANAGHGGRALALMHRNMRASPLLSHVPLPLLAALLGVATRTPWGRGTRALLTTGTGELLATLAEVESAQDFAGLPSSTHFMAGAKSPRYFRATAQRLHRAVAGSTYAESPDGLHASVPAAIDELVGDLADYFREGPPSTKS
ncbi:alpha/beta hydrolase [Zhihengliuella flava]|uniref:Pimeloyl-ACP methyl ester carboxylesterase n=1 Tax=Zhihengliuella flava TaxID=1285193 RepID=A0A931DAB3_9MICC|nr:alpha/beta hydrolase [Zhihengliuella flava]MBG6084822.1 pimeloyl-ACP methyl ester carboxylesterase [Zhihengliuella flava]